MGRKNHFLLEDIFEVWIKFWLPEEGFEEQERNKDIIRKRMNREK